MKTLIIKVEVPDDVMDNEIEVTIPGAGRYAIRVKSTVIPRPTDLELTESAGFNIDGIRRSHFKAGCQWVINKLWGTE